MMITATLHVSGLPTEEGFGVRLGWTRIPWEENDDLVENKNSTLSQLKTSKGRKVHKKWERDDLSLRLQGGKRRR